MKRRLLCALLPLLFLLSAHADTYRATAVYPAQAEAYAIDDYGDYQLLFSSYSDSLPSGCTYGQGFYCFLTHYEHGDFNVYTTNYAPDLPTDLSPIAGPGCPAAPIDYSLVSCNNGHPFYVGPYEHGFYSTPDPSGLLFGGTGDNFKESASGNLLYQSGEDTEVVILDLTTLASTPEPSSFALLGTGLLGVAGVLKRRYA